MKRQTKRVIATVETTTDKGGTEFVVSDARTVTLRFPKATHGYAGTAIDFVRTLTPEEALAIASELHAAADRVTAAQPEDAS